jgi:membrane fusion protein, multidrug efflux system
MSVIEPLKQNSPPFVNAPSRMPVPPEVIGAPPKSVHGNASDSTVRKTSKPSRLKRTVKLAALAIIGGALLVFIILRIIEASKPAPPKKQPIPPVSVAQPIQRDVIYKVEYGGDVLPIQQTNIFSRVAGILSAVYTDMGHTVRAGQLVALIDTSAAYQTELQAEATYLNAKATEARERDLAAKDLASRQDLDNAIAARRTAEASYESARIQLNYSKITAPFHGWVTKRYLDPGSVVTNNPIVGNSNSTIFNIMDIDSLKIDINITDRDIPLLNQVKSATVTVDAMPGRQWTAFVSHSAQALNTTTRTMPVEIVVPNRDETLKPGVFANVTLVLGEHPKALTVPMQAVLRDTAGHPYVLIVQDTIAKKRLVQLGISDEGWTEILSGLDGSEHVIVTGQNFARPNGKVTIIQTAVSSAPLPSQAAPSATFPGVDTSAVKQY